MAGWGMRHPFKGTRCFGRIGENVGKARMNTSPRFLATHSTPAPGGFALDPAINIENVFCSKKLQSYIYLYLELE